MTSWLLFLSPILAIIACFICYRAGYKAGDKNRLEAQNLAKKMSNEKATLFLISILIFFNCGCSYMVEDSPLCRYRYDLSDASIQKLNNHNRFKFCHDYDFCFGDNEKLKEICK